MHEWSLAEAIISAASKIAKEEGLDRVTEVNIGLGELQQVEPELFEFALSQVKTELFHDAVFNIERVKARFSCRACSHEWSFEARGLEEETREAIHFVPDLAHAFTQCPECRSRDFAITEGRGVWLNSLKGDRPDG